MCASMKKLCFSLNNFILFVKECVFSLTHSLTHSATRARQRRARQPPDGMLHEWVHRHGNSACPKCLTFARSDAAHGTRRFEACLGSHSALSAVIFANQGHRLAAVEDDSGEVILFCLECGAFALGQPAKLLALWGGAQPKGSACDQTLRRIEKGRAPRARRVRGCLSSSPLARSTRSPCVTNSTPRSRPGRRQRHEADGSERPPRPPVPSRPPNESTPQSPAEDDDDDTPLALPCDKERRVVGSEATVQLACSAGFPCQPRGIERSAESCFGSATSSASDRMPRLRQRVADCAALRGGLVTDSVLGSDDFVGASSDPECIKHACTPQTADQVMTQGLRRLDQAAVTAISDFE